jgi:hypothetical protein
MTGADALAGTDLDFASGSRFDFKICLFELRFVMPAPAPGFWRNLSTPEASGVAIRGVYPPCEANGKTIPFTLGYCGVNALADLRVT